MAGLLTHLGFGVLGFLIIWFAFYRETRKTKIIYGLLFILANIAPDLIDFGILSIVMGSFSPDEIMTHKAFHALAIFGHTYSNWIFGGLVVFLISSIFYYFDKISKKNLIRVLIAIVLFLIGVAIHLRLDVLIMETSYWI